MKRTAVLVLASVFILSACSAVQLPGQPTVSPGIDTQATQAAMAATLAAETLNALPTPTLVLAAETLCAHSDGNRISIPDGAGYREFHP